MINLILGDCLEVMKTLPDKSVDAVITDPPYGTTACKWDTVIPFEPLWSGYKRLVKDNGAIVLHCQQPFTSLLILSSIDIFRYTWVWNKNYAPNFMNANKMHTKNFEDIAVFYKAQPTFNPQKEPGRPYLDKRKPHARIVADVYGTKPYSRGKDASDGLRSPTGIINISGKSNSNVHPTQKPTALMEYLVKTYTNAGGVVLDSCMGSGTTGVACVQAGRDFIGIEIDPGYFAIAERRIKEAQAQGGLF
jgi:site-specific DNA-methyltransferase (adenine-specific)